jgi:hypothetical protein
MHICSSLATKTKKVGNGFEELEKENEAGQIEKKETNTSRYAS